MSKKKETPPLISGETANKIYVAMEKKENAYQAFERARHRFMRASRRLSDLQLTLNFSGKEVTV